METRQKTGSPLELHHGPDFRHFVQTIENLYGCQGGQWIDTLPARVADCARQWNLSDIMEGNHLSFHYIVTAVRTTDNTPVVIKLAFDAGALTQEKMALSLYNGNGCVRLLAADEQQQALLLERLIPGTSLVSLFPHHDARAVEHAAHLMHQLHTTPRSTVYNLQTTATLLATLDQQVEGIPHAHLHKARGQAHKLIASEKNRVVLHGDLHQGNILKNGAHYCAIDPKGIIGEAAYDVGPFIRNPTQQLIERDDAGTMIKQRMELFSHLMRIDYERIKSWCYVQSVLAACWHKQDNSGHDVIDDCIRIAELIDQL